MTIIQVDIQRSNDTAGSPSDEEVESWVQFVIEEQNLAPATVELSLQFVNEDEISALNQSYRDKSGPTNVLSFPFDEPPGYPPQPDYQLLGDIVICAPVLSREAAEQGKLEKHHWAHLVIHGVLHLLGFDHQTENEALQMEQQEIALLAHFLVPDPYKISESLNQNETV